MIGTMNILAACSGPDSPVRKFVFKSSAHYYGCEQDDPAFFTERMQRPHPPHTRIERDIVEAEQAVRSFAERNTRRDGHDAALRQRPRAGPADAATRRLLSLPVVPGILGFDPRYQFIHEDDIVGVLEHAVREDLPGIYNAAADGVLVLSEIAGLLGKPFAPLLPPWGTGLAAAPLRRLGLNLSPEMLSQLRFGRGVDNRKLKAAGVPLRHTTRETVQALAEHLRIAAIRSGEAVPYRYEREVEEFLRYSPSVRRGAEQAAESPRLTASKIAGLAAGIAPVLPSVRHSALPVLLHRRGGPRPAARRGGRRVRVRLRP